MELRCETVVVSFLFRALRGFRDAHPEVGLTPAEADYLRWTRSGRECYTLKYKLSDTRHDLRRMTARYDRMSSLCGRQAGRIRTLEEAGALDAQRLQEENAQLRREQRTDRETLVSLRAMMREMRDENERAKEDVARARQDRQVAERRASGLAREVNEIVSQYELCVHGIHRQCGVCHLCQPEDGSEDGSPEGADHGHENVSE